MRLDRSSAASWSTAWLASAAQSRSLWPTWCRDSTSRSTTRMTLSRGRSPTFPQTSTSWGSSWTLRGHWACKARVTTVPATRSSCSSPRRPITTSSSWTRWSQHENGSEQLASSFAPGRCGTLGLRTWQYLCTKRKVKRYFLKEPNLDADCIKLILNALNLTEDESCSSWRWSLGTRSHNSRTFQNPSSFFLFQLNLWLLFDCYSLFTSCNMDAYVLLCICHVVAFYRLKASFSANRFVEWDQTETLWSSSKTWAMTSCPSLEYILSIVFPVTDGSFHHRMEHRI